MVEGVECPLVEDVGGAKMGYHGEEGEVAKVEGGSEGEGARKEVDKSMWGSWIEFLDF
jgi:hypothetical protein